MPPEILKNWEEDLVKVKILGRSGEPLRRRDHLLGWASETGQSEQGKLENEFEMLRRQSSERMVEKDDSCSMQQFDKNSKGGVSQALENEDNNLSAKEHDLTPKRSVSDLLTCTSSQKPDLTPKGGQNDNKMPGVDGTNTGKRYGSKDQSQSPSLSSIAVPWKRTSSLSSRGSGGFSHSSSSRSMQIQSPSSGDAAAGDGLLASPPSLEEPSPRKKQRLGWGQGLAKYEKRKVEGSDETVSKSALAPCSTSTGLPSLNPGLTSNSECASPVMKLSSPSPHLTTLSVCASPTARLASPGLRLTALSDCASPCTRLTSPSQRLTTLSECASPVTTSSIACYSSPGLDEKPHMESVNNDNGTSNLTVSPTHELSVNHFHIELPNHDLVESYCVRLVNLLQSEETIYGDFGTAIFNSTSKLMLLKSEFLSYLETAEAFIDLCENELKQLVSEIEVLQDATVQPLVFQKPPPLQLESSEELIGEVQTLSNDVLKEVGEDLKEDDIDSPGTATSKFVEPSLVEKKVSVPDNYASLSDLRPALSSVDEKSPFNSRDANGINENSVALSVCCTGEEEDCTILTTNRVTARETSEAFNSLLPSSTSPVDLWGVISSTLSQQSSDYVKEKLRVYKGNIKFKERALALKYRALQYMWKEDLKFQHLKKNKAKLSRGIESSSRLMNCGYQKHRSSTRSRFTSSGSNVTLLPTAEAEKYTLKLLLEKQYSPCRDTLKMPALILGEKEKKLSRFVNSNGLVEDPCAIEKERSMTNPWTPKEKDIFIEMLATFGKNFVKIASFLEHKTTADCVQFYYKNQKSDSFEKIKKKPEQKQGRSFPSDTYLLPQGMTSTKKSSREVNAVSLDLLGAASAYAAHADARSGWGGQLCNKKVFWGSEKEVVAADALAGISGAISCEAMGSCLTSSLDSRDRCKKKFVFDRPLTSESLRNVNDADEETCSDDSCGETVSVDWTDQEKSDFVVAVGSYGKDFVKIARFMKTKSSNQCRIFFSKARKSLGLDMIHPASGNEGKPACDINGEKSDTEDACHLESESAMCSTQSYSKMDTDPLSAADEIPHVMKPDSEETEPESSGKGDSGDPGQTQDVLLCDAVVVSGVSLNSTEGELIGNSKLNDNANITEDVKKEGDEINPVESTFDKLDNSPYDFDEELKPEPEPEPEQHQSGASDAECNTISSRSSQPDSNIMGADPKINFESETPFSRSNTDFQSSTTSWQQQEDDHLSTSQNSHIQNSSENPLHVTLSSTLNFEEARKKEQQKNTPSICMQQRLSGSKHLLNGADKSHILRGFPPQVLHKGETDRGVGSTPHIVNDINAKVNNGIGLANAAMHRVHSKKHDQLPFCSSKSISDTEEHARRVGDVKLFGQILSNSSSSSQKLGSSSPHNQVPSSSQKQVLKPRESNSNVLNISSKIPLKVSVNNYPTNIENYPIRTHGFWDGSRIQTVPESALLISKYPGSFSVNQQSLPAIVKRNDRNLGSVAVFPTPNLGLRDYRHVYRGYDAHQNQSLMTAGVFSELQKRELASFQQQPRLLGGGVLVGSGCTTGISDPVAAIRKHYAKQEGRSQNGDIGR